MERIIKHINAMSGRYHPHGIFQDWVQMMAISISNQLLFNQDLENQYLSIAHRYSKDEILTMCEMNEILVMLFEEKIYDYLGEIYMS